MLDRGIERGDLRDDLDIDLALDVLGGPLFYRLLITGGPIDEQLAEGVVELILRGFAPQTEIAPNGRRKQDEDPRNPDRDRRHHDEVAGRAWDMADAGS